VIGIAATIHPAALDTATLKLHFPAMLAFTVALFFMAYNYKGNIRLSRGAGAILLIGFIAYHITVAIETF
jgi:Ca2+/Na+ antiporter